MNSKMLAMLVVVAVLAGVGGWWAASSRAPGRDASGTAAVADGPCPGGAEALFWKAPMDPTYVRDQPGKSPMGMDLVPVCPGGGGEAAAEGVRISPNVVQSMGVRTVVVAQRDMTRQVRAVGRVDYDERLISHVHTKIQGWIESLHVEYAGQVVRKGQVMLEIYSPDLVATQEELLVANRYRESMASSDFPDLQKGGESLFEATRRRLELWDIPDRDIERLLSSGEIRKTVTLYAPAGGVVTAIMARQGMEVTANHNLYTIADLSRVWIYADIYEYEVAWVAVGQSAKVELRHMPGVTLEAKVTYIYPYLNPATRTVRVRLELPNPGLILKPEMYANVVIETATREAGLAVPEEAIIRSGRRNLVVLALGEGRFEPREVELGLDSGDGWIEIQSGVAQGDIAVTSGQFLINSESSLQEAVQKLLAGRDAAAKAPQSPGHEGHAIPDAESADTADDPHRGNSMGDMTPDDAHPDHPMPTEPSVPPGHDHGAMQPKGTADPMSPSMDQE